MRIFSLFKICLTVNSVSLFFNPQKINNNIYMNKIVDMLEAINV